MIRKLSIVIATMLLLPVAPLFASPDGSSVYLVKDIYPGDSDSIARDSVEGLTSAVQGRALFWPYSGGSGLALWSSDGTAAGTSLVTDLIRRRESPKNGTLCFSEDAWFFHSQAAFREETTLWRTDGTTEGTWALARFDGNTAIWEPTLRPDLSCAARSVGGRVMFWVGSWRGTYSDIELWSTDGTSEGTSRVAELGQSVFFARPPTAFVRHGGFVYFNMSIGATPRGLWRTDGTAAGTTLQIAVIPGYGPFDSDFLESHGERIYFRSRVPVPSSSTTAIASTDGTPAGTVVFPEHGLASGFEVLPGFEAVDGRLVFPAFGDSWDLWAFEPDATQPTRLTDFPADYGVFPMRVSGEFPPEFGALYWVTSPGTYLTLEKALVRTDGTLAGTGEIFRFCVSGSSSCSVSTLGRAGDWVLMLVVESGHQSVWRTDGTSDGTQLVAALSKVAGADLTAYVSTGERVFFYVGGLWASDGTVEGTSPVTDDAQGDINAFLFELGTAVLPSGDLLFPHSTAANGTELWRSDGTTEGTRMVIDLSNTPNSSSASSFSGSEGKLLFRGDDGTTGDEPWFSDGSSSGTVLVVDANPGSFGSDPKPLGRLGDRWPVVLWNYASSSTRLAFTTGDVGDLEFAQERWIWGFDGEYLEERFESLLVASNTQVIWSVEDSPPHSTLLAETPFVIGDQHGMISPGERGIYFGQVEPETDLGVWITNGTPGSTRRYCGGSDLKRFSGSPEVVEVEEGILFNGNHLLLGAQLFRCTHEGADAVNLQASPAWPSYSGSPKGMTRIGEWVLFSALDDAGDRELWRTDGSLDGIDRVGDLNPSGSSDPREFFVGGEFVLFVADDGVHGRELWITDGGAAGTRMLKDVAPGVFSSDPADFVALDGAVLFSASTIEHGRELWVTVGTEESTRLLQDVWPGPASSSPEELESAGERVYFRATTDVGTELWAACPEWAASSSVQGATIVEGDADFVDVEVRLLAPAFCGDSRFTVQTVAGSATAGADFDPLTTEVRLGEANPTTLVRIAIADDSVSEDGEEFSVVLRDVLGRIRDTATILIIDDDGGGDADADGIPSAIEDQSPNGGDANWDGVPDSLQPGVASYSLGASGRSVTLEILAGCSRLTSVLAHESSSYTGDLAYFYPFGLTSFELPDCSAARLRLLLHGMPAAECELGALRKALQRQPESAGAADWIDATGVAIETVSFGAASACAASFDAIDGALGDLAPEANRIEDPVGLGIPLVAEIPALRFAGVLLFAVLLALLALFVLRRRERKSTS